MKDGGRKRVSDWVGGERKREGDRERERERGRVRRGTINYVLPLMKYLTILSTGLKYKVQSTESWSTALDG